MNFKIICATALLLGAVQVPFPVAAQMSASINLSTYGGDSREARAARGRCWRKAGIPHSRSPQNEAEASAIRSCVDKELAERANTTAPSGPYVKVDESRTRPGCFIIRVVSSGRSWKVSGRDVVSHGNCNPNLLKGTIIANNQVRISDGRVCTFDHTGRGTCR